MDKFEHPPSEIAPKVEQETTSLFDQQPPIQQQQQLPPPPSQQLQLQQEQQQQQQEQRQHNIVDIQKVNNLVLKYPELKDAITQAMLLQLIKYGDISEKDIEKIHQTGEQKVPFIVKKYKYLSKNAHTKSDKFTVDKINAWENMIPSNAVIATF